jgi:hypothetical protein
MPDINWDRYEIENIETIEDESISPFTWRVNFYVVEKNIKPQWHEEELLLSKWFYETKKVRDFQVRTKIGTLYIKRRKWYNKDKREIVYEDLNIEYEETKSPEDLIFFLPTVWKLKNEYWNNIIIKSNKQENTFKIFSKNFSKSKKRMIVYMMNYLWNSFVIKAMIF